MRFYYSSIIIGLLLLSCSQAKHSELPEFPVDINQDSLLLLSEIAEEIIVIEPELTDESVIGTGSYYSICRIISTENNLIVAMGGLSSGEVLVFNNDGKFVRSIGSRGQGPGEHNSIQNIAFDEKNSRLYILSYNPNKVICYNLDGKFLKESLLEQSGWPYSDIIYHNDELFLDQVKIVGEHILKRIVYRMNDNLQFTDSIICWENYFEKINSASRFKDYLVKNGTSIYFYPKELYGKWDAPNVKVLRDTLYRIEENQLIPELKLKFRNDGFDSHGDKIIDLHNLYRSTRYIFAYYEYNPNNRERNAEPMSKYYFCYDTKTGKGYNMLDGFMDDIHGIEKRVGIHPLTSDSEYFYYWHTHMNPNDLEEPNPTIYIGKLKK